jgi:hypothetical protein
LFEQRDRYPATRFPLLQCKGEAGRQLQALERQLSVNDILGCRHAARRVLDASLAASSGMGAAVEDAGGTRSVLGRVQPHPPSLEKSSAAPSRPAAAAAPVAAAPGTAAPAAVGSQPASFADSSSVEGSSSDGSGRRRGYLAWGLSRAAGFLRYLPYSTPGEVRTIPLVVLQIALPPLGCLTGNALKFGAWSLICKILQDSAVAILIIVLY